MNIFKKNKNSDKYYFLQRLWNKPFLKPIFSYMKDKKTAVKG